MTSLFQNVRSVFSRAGDDRDFHTEEQPLRTELLSVEQLERHARALAGFHRVDPRGGADRLLARLLENERLIAQTHAMVAEAVPKGARMVPAEEWLLDNYHLIETHVRAARRHLPRSYSRQLPRLLHGPMAGYPRVYDIATDLITHVDGYVDRENLERFVTAYQSIEPLMLGELWAVPIMLRLALIENLRRVMSRVRWQRRQQELADAWADRLIETAHARPEHLIIELAEMVKVNPPLTTAFVPHFMRRLQGSHPALSLAINWVEQQLNESGQTSDQMMQVANQNEAADQIAVGNSIRSLRSLGAMDWREFVESLSVVDKTLRQDPGQVYGHNDFATRDRCRHIVERLSKRSRSSELEVARRAVKLAEAQMPATGHVGAGDERLYHVGYYLLDEGLLELEQAIGYIMPARQRLGRLISRVRLGAYLAAVALVAAVLTITVAARAVAFGAEPWAVALLAVAALIAASQVALSLVNMVVTRLVPPRILPKLDFKDGIRHDCRTVVVVPALVDSRQDVDELLSDMEVRHLGNRDPNLRFTILTDFPDAPQETAPGDQDLLDRLRRGTQALNERYRDGADVFFWLHRDRIWNQCEQCWMGWERKRGKLMQFNALLRHGDAAAFSHTAGEITQLTGSRYVITLDADTRLPRDSARKIIGAGAHPLNRPRIDGRTGRVTVGHAVLQPRVAAGLHGATRSRYALLMSGETGIDPYTRQVSDVYQDVFGEGSFIGKGLYDVDVFDRIMEGRVPENLILSHDLIESAFARSGLINDVELIEDYPAGYLADMSRRHRWVRGDWQIVAWLGPRAPRAQGEWASPGISRLYWWKIFDNIRRSFFATALVLLALIGWFAAPQHAGAWSAVIVLAVILPALLDGLFDIVSKSRDQGWLGHLAGVGDHAGRRTARAALDLAFLPYQAWIDLDATFRSLYRMTVSRRRLLEWRTSGKAEQLATRNLIGHVRAMWIGPALALAVILAGALTDPALLRGASPLLVMWLVGPAVAWWLSQPPAVKVRPLDAQQRLFLRRVARLTWRYYERFASVETNYLAPDNFQEDLRESPLDTRTSPTNIGMGLISALAAFDFGYLSVARLIDRTNKTLGSMEELERYHGHFYNWYDTRTLATLNPQYVSAVDSGNLAGILLVLQSGLEELAHAPVLPQRTLQGLGDTLALCAEQVAGGRTTVVGAPRPAPPRVRDTAQATVTRLAKLLQDDIADKPSLRLLADVLQEAAGEAARLTAALTGEAADPELRWWCEAFETQCRDMLDDLRYGCPWLALAAPQPDVAASLPPDVRELIQALDRPLTLRRLAGLALQHNPMLHNLLTAPASDGEPADKARAYIQQLHDALELAATRAAERIEQLNELAERCAELAQMDFRVLYDADCDLLRIGLNVRDHRPDQSYYDLVASEARLASYFAIAMGQLPLDHWFALGRLVTLSAGHKALVSWSGSMFEYLMPLLIMPTFPTTLLDVTYHTVVRRQIEYGAQRRIPWGVSESAYAGTDVAGKYQYQAFGVPGLGLKRGLSSDLVIAPYASALGLMVMPREAAQNLQRLAAEGVLGRYGFFEAVDYTRSRLSRSQERIVVPLYMAHHSGMTLLSLAYALLDRPMQRRFMANPWMKSTELLLQERTPREVDPVYPHAAEAREAERSVTGAKADIRVYRTTRSPAPALHLLSNGRYHVMVTAAGSGYSRWNEIGVTRWYEDPTREQHGQFCYIRDVLSGKVWSTTFQPTQAEPDDYEVIFSQAKAEFRRTDRQIHTYTQIGVSPEDDVEVRRITINNRSRTRRTIELTSFAEVVLIDPNADASHRAFTNLFVQTQIIRDRQAILVTRRRRSVHESPPSMFHQMLVRGRTVGETHYETDRNRFVGRTRNTAAPAAMDRGAQLENSEGSVLDPIVAIRRSIVLEPDESATVDLIMGVAPTAAAAGDLIAKYQDHHFADRVFEIAWTHSQLTLQHLGATESDAQLFGRLAGALIYANAAFRARPTLLRANRFGQSRLWGYGISGDLPIVLLVVSSMQRTEVVRQILQAHAYWRAKGLKSDLVIINDDFSGYRNELHDRLTTLVTTSPEAAYLDKPGGVFIRRGEQIAQEDRTLLQAVARIVLTDAGDLAEQAERPPRNRPSIPRLEPTSDPWVEPPQPNATRDLLFFNGHGGFTHDGREYITLLPPGIATPAPWSNVIANERFGTVVTESGGGYTWFENAHEYRLTPWENDPVTDSGGEALYIRDENTGQYFSPTPLPARGKTPYISRHGFGYSAFEHVELGLQTELWTYVAIDAPIKFYVLKLRNLSGRSRRLSVSACFELVLGERRGKTADHIVTEVDAKTGALFARNHYNGDFPGRVTFVNCLEPVRTVTGDRGEFIGRYGSLARPAAMKRTQLSGRLGAGFDPCAAMMAPIHLPEGQEREVVFMMGAAVDENEARQVLGRFSRSAAPRHALEAVWEFWNRTLGAVNVRTPDPSVDVLVNGWLMYQIISSRIWGRTGYYQSGGAYGFRDQLQDTMAVVHAAPHLYRHHLLRCAAHQFVEGDVQHWWHPPTGRGVRTRIRDDYLWLPYAVARYVVATGDTGVLDERRQYLHGRPLQEGEESYYDLPQVMDEAGPLYEHCVRAIEQGLQFGEHGLPLIGAGDWNDGMNEVGPKGRGESVWLAFFLYDVLVQFAAVARGRGDAPFADKCIRHADQLKRKIHEHTWDGAWYLRAFFDDGRPLGTSADPECQIDALPQSWSALTGAGDPQRTAAALKAVDQRLVDREIGMIKLFDPPFDKSELEPGYIKGYVPGVRENGGQYTHAAIWTVMAFAAVGDVERAWELLRMINPVHHGGSRERMETYKVEPYVVAADVYAVSPHEGRGGWTWYTGSAGWMYRLMLETMLGVRLEVDRLRFEPRLPAKWRGYEVHYRYRSTVYHLSIVAPEGHQNRVARITVDNVDQPDLTVKLIDDRGDHHGTIELA